MGEGWMGEERRSANITLNDLLLEIREVKMDVKNLLKGFDEHKADDKSQFAEIKKDVVWVQRIVFGAIGAYLFFQFLISAGAFRSNSGVSNSYYSSPIPFGVNTPNVVRNSDSKGENRVA